MKLPAATLAFALLAPACLPQTSRPAPDLAALRPVMIRLQEGRWDADAAKSVIKSLVDGGHPFAARWWIDLAEGAVKQTSLPGSVWLALAGLRREADAKTASPDDLKVVRKLVRHAESASASRNYVEAERLCALAKTVLGFVPEVAASKSLAALEKGLQGQPRQDSDPQNLQRQKKESAPTESAAQDLIERSLAKSVADYEVAGVRAARLAILKAIESPAAAMPDKQRESLAGRVLGAARTVEPTKSATVFLRGVQPVGVHRDRAPFVFSDGSRTFSSAENKGLDFQAFDGEVIQFRPAPAQKPESRGGLTGDVTGNLFAVGALLNGRPLPKSNWFWVAEEEADRTDPKLNSIAFGRKVKTSDRDSDYPIPPEMQEIKQLLMFGDPFSKGFCIYPFREVHETVEAEIKAFGVIPAWVGTWAPRLVIALRVDFQ